MVSVLENWSINSDLPFVSRVVEPTASPCIEQDERFVISIAKPRAATEEVPLPWFSENTDWVDWCHDNMPEWIKAHNHFCDLTVTFFRDDGSVEPNPNAILMLNTEGDRKNFVNYMTSNDAFKKNVLQWGNISICETIFDYGFLRDKFAGLGMSSGCVTTLDGWDVPSCAVWNPASITYKRTTTRGR